MGKDVGTEDILLTDGGNVNLCGHYAHQNGSPTMGVLIYPLIATSLKVVKEWSQPRVTHEQMSE